MIDQNIKILGDFISTTKGFAFKSRCYSDKGKPLVKVSNFTENSIDITNLISIPDEIAKQYKKYSLSKDDVLIQTVGSYPSNPQSVVGKVIRVPSSASGSLLNQNAVIIKPNTQLQKIFLYYLLKNDDFKYYILGTARGAANQASITLESIHQYKFLLPPHPTQCKIAAILSTYDDLIEKNTRRIKILGEMAQGIYREWFVHFRFPGYESVQMVESELGLIPEGWEVRKLGGISENFDRFRKPLSKMQRDTRKGSFPYYGAARIFDFIDDYLFDGYYLLLAEDGSVITPDRKPVLQLVNGKFWANNHTHILKAKPPFSIEYLYLMLNNFDISGYITGAAQPKINQENLNRIPIVSPTNEILDEFNSIVRNIFYQIFLFEQKNSNLRQTRDLLLPKLISGDLNVSELDIKISEVMI